MLQQSSSSLEMMFLSFVQSAEPLLKGRIQGFTASKLGDLLFKDVNMRSMNYSL